MAIEFVTLLLKGVLIGFLVSIPVGPAGIMGIQRILSKGRLAGFVTGVGSATADAMFALIAVFLLPSVQPFIDENSNLIKALGGVLCIIVGAFIYMQKIKRPSVVRSHSGGASHTSSYISTLMVTLLNPAYLIFLLGLFAFAGVGDVQGVAEGLAIVLGVFLGACACWLLLVWSVGKLRKNITIRNLWWLNKISGVVLAALGVIFIVLGMK